MKNGATKAAPFFNPAARKHFRYYFQITDAPTVYNPLLSVWHRETIMADRGLTKLVHSLRQILPGPDAGGQSDGQLLARFIAARDQAAFAALFHRHGPMVLGVCRRVLNDWHDAEDAFQATFLVLTRKAGSVVKRESVASWLYGVAYRTALEARAVAARRKMREKQTAELPHPAARPAEPQDWRPLLDRELCRLPEKYRAGSCCATWKAGRVKKRRCGWASRKAHCLACWRRRGGCWRSG